MELAAVDSYQCFFEVPQFNQFLGHLPALETFSNYPSGETKK